MLSKKELLQIHQKQMKKLLEAEDHFKYIFESYRELMNDESIDKKDIAAMGENIMLQLKKVDRARERMNEIGQLYDELKQNGEIQ